MNILNMKKCVGILTCPKNIKRFDKFMKNHKTPFEENNIMYYIIQSDPSLIKTGKKYRLSKNYFYVAVNEAYELLANKLAIFYSFIYEKTDYDIVFKVDDGCLLKMDVILSPPNYDYFGSLMIPTSNICHKGKCKNKDYNKISLDFRHGFHKTKMLNNIQLSAITKIEYAGGGYGYGLSRNALKHYVNYKEYILTLPFSYEDVLLGQIMYLSNITPKCHQVGKYHKIKE